MEALIVFIRVILNHARTEENDVWPLIFKTKIFIDSSHFHKVLLESSERYFWISIYRLGYFLKDSELCGLLNGVNLFLPSFFILAQHSHEIFFLHRNAATVDIMGAESEEIVS